MLACKQMRILDRSDIIAIIRDLKETSMTPKGDTHEHENMKVFSYQKL